ncbi:hypothetical protein T484DRAFT_1835873, partial [Baffinella frigidus]
MAPMPPVTYTTLVDAAAQDGRPGGLKRGLKLLDEMTTRGVAPSAVTFNVMIKACAAGARRASEGQGHPSNRRQGAAQGHPSNRRQGAAQELLAEALWVLARMREAGVRPDLYSHATDAIELLEEALWVLARMREVGVRPDLYSHTTDAIELLEEALWVLARMREAGVRPDLYSYNTLLSACAAAAADARIPPRNGLRPLTLLSACAAAAADARIPPRNGLRAVEQMRETFGVSPSAAVFLELAQDAGAADAITTGLRLRELTASRGGEDGGEELLLVDTGAT